MGQGWKIVQQLALPADQLLIQSWVSARLNFFKGIAWKGFRISETWESSSHDYCPTEDNTKEAWWSIMGVQVLP